jgi:hypothetical protein
MRESCGPPSNEQIAETSMELNDELLSAYLDDALDAAGSASVAAALQADPGARLRLESMREADRALRAALPLKQGDIFESALAEGMRSRPTGRRMRHVLPWALAASLAGLIVGYLLPRAGVDSTAHPMDAALQAALASQHSGAAVESGTQMVLSFQAADGRYCRLFRAGTAEAMGEGLACRDASGDWKLTAWDASAPTAVNGFRTAGVSALVDGAMATLGGKPAMSATEEDAVIARQWRDR